MSDSVGQASIIRISDSIDVYVWNRAGKLVHLTAGTHNGWVYRAEEISESQNIRAPSATRWENDIDVFHSRNTNQFVHL